VIRATDICGRRYRGPALRGGSPFKERDESKWIETLAWEVRSTSVSMLTRLASAWPSLCPFVSQLQGPWAPARAVY